jgi:hypothetical protein
MEIDVMSKTIGALDFEPTCYVGLQETDIDYDRDGDAIEAWLDRESEDICYLVDDHQAVYFMLQSDAECFVSVWGGVLGEVVQYVRQPGLCAEVLLQKLRERTAAKTHDLRAKCSEA